MQSTDDVGMSAHAAKSWQEFRDAGLLWWVNRILHTFGWSMIVEVDDQNKTVSVYPARVAFRGFSLGSEEEGFKKVSAYMRDNADNLLSEAITGELTK